MSYRVEIACWLVVTASIIVGMSGCAPYRVEYMEDSLRKTTQAELVQKFGYPQRLKRVRNGEQVWEYDFQSGERKCVTYAVTFNTDDELREWERRDCPQKQRPQ